MRNTQWVNDALPKTPPDTDNEYQSQSQSYNNLDTYNQFNILTQDPTLNIHSKYVYTDNCNTTDYDDESEEEDVDDLSDDIGDEPLYDEHGNLMRSHPRIKQQNQYNDHNDDNDESYGSDNEDINSDDALYDLIPIDEEIDLNDLSLDEINNFHKHLYGYYDCTRSSQKSCQARYDILCMINEIWQEILIKREFKKNNFEIFRPSEYSSFNSNIHDQGMFTANCDNKGFNNTTKQGLYIKEIYDDDIKYEPYKIDNESVEWLTPCSAPRKHIRLINHNGEILYNKIIPSASIFGSIRTRLDCEGSDMDITLPNSVDNPIIDVWFNKNEQKSKLTEFLSILNYRIDTKHKSLKNYKFEVFPVLNAKVPIIKIKETAITGVEMDIAIQSSQQSVANLVNYYCDCDDRIRPFIICIKHWSKTRGLCDAMNNYPNSFGFVLLSIKFLQMVNILPICSIDDIVNNNDNAKINVIQEIDSSKPYNTDTLLELMIQFFEMYHRFNFKLLQISTSRRGLESKICHEYYTSFKYAHQTTMVVEDPSSRSANVTRNVRPYRLTIMQKEFFRGYKACKHGDWQFLMTKYINPHNDIDIFDKYPPSDVEQEYLFNIKLKDEAMDNALNNDENENDPQQFQDAEATTSASPEAINDNNNDQQPLTDLMVEAYGDYDENEHEQEQEPADDETAVTGQYDDADTTITSCTNHTNNNNNNALIADETYSTHYKPEHDEENQEEYEYYNENDIESESIDMSLPRTEGTATPDPADVDDKEQDEEDEPDLTGYPDTRIKEEEYVINSIGGRRRGRGGGCAVNAGYGRGRGANAYNTYNNNEDGMKVIGIGNRTRGRGRGTVRGRIHSEPASSVYSIYSASASDGKTDGSYTMNNSNNDNDDDSDYDDDNVDETVTIPYSKVKYVARYSAPRKVNIRKNKNNKKVSSGLKLSSILVQKLDDKLCNDDILLFWKLTPFKNELFESMNIDNDNFSVEYINIYLNNYKINMDQFIGISKFYIIQFIVSFINTHTNNNNDNIHSELFKILKCQDLKILQQQNDKKGIEFQIKHLKYFNKYNDNDHYGSFLSEIESETQQNEYKIPNIMNQNINISSSFNNYAYFASFISLFSFWKSLFDTIDNEAITLQNRNKALSYLSNKEWITSKIKNSMISIGLKHLTQIQLFKWLKQH